MQNITARTILSGQPDRIEVDYTNIYTEGELEAIENQDSAERIKSSWTTDNEDFGRYFGYEKGINNYWYFEYSCFHFCFLRTHFSSKSHLWTYFL